MSNFIQKWVSHVKNSIILQYDMYAGNPTKQAEQVLKLPVIWIEYRMKCGFGTGGTELIYRLPKPRLTKTKIFDMDNQQ